MAGDPVILSTSTTASRLRIDEFVHLMRRNDIFELMFVVRGSIGRNKFGLLQSSCSVKPWRAPRYWWKRITMWCVPPWTLLRRAVLPDELFRRKCDWPSTRRAIHTGEPHCSCRAGRSWVLSRWCGRTLMDNQHA
jgi:hypothetical protein